MHRSLNQEIEKEVSFGNSWDGREEIQAPDSLTRTGLGDNKGEVSDSPSRVKLCGQTNCRVLNAVMEEGMGSNSMISTMAKLYY